MAAKGNSHRRYPPELKERAVRLVFDVRDEAGKHRGAIVKVSQQLGISKDTLFNWVHEAELERARLAGMTSADRERIKVLERETFELRRSNEILKAAALFFQAELDRPQPR